MSSAQFLLDRYKQLLVRIKQERTITEYSTFEHLPDNAVFLRHDIDVSLNAALQLARIENEHQVHSNYFVNLHADSYNGHSGEVRRQIAQLVAMGHQIGIHLDSAYYGGIETKERLLRILIDETEAFRNLFQVDPIAFSFHNPTDEQFRFGETEYAGLVNCYAERFRTSIAYISDSNGYWRHGSIDEALTVNSRRPIQVLTHAEWWSEKELQPRERLADAQFFDVFVRLRAYDEALHQFGRENRSEVSQYLSQMSVEQSGIETFNRIFRPSETLEEEH